VALFVDSFIVVLPPPACCASDNGLISLQSHSRAVAALPSGMGGAFDKVTIVVVVGIVSTTRGYSCWEIRFIFLGRD